MSESVYPDFNSDKHVIGGKSRACIQFAIDRVGPIAEVSVEENHDENTRNVMLHHTDGSNTLIVGVLKLPNEPTDPPHAPGRRGS